MVPHKQFPKEHKTSNSSSKIHIQDSKSSHGVNKNAPISGLAYVINTLRTNGHNPILENFIRGVVREVVETKIQELQFSREKLNDEGKFGGRPLELCIINPNKLPNTLFTHSNIIAKDEEFLQIALIDVKSKSIVNDGPLSSTKLEICALNGEFGACGSEDWNENDFNVNILQGRDGKEPLLVGDRFITLKNGVASIYKIKFTDNSRWLRGNMFRLGIKTMQNGEIIKECRSQPFRVKDNRGEPYKKHFPPLLNDEVWRLMKIAKDGKFHKRLFSHRIYTVKDLLRLLIINESLLHKVLEKIPKKSWLALMEHAKTCVVDDYKLYSYQTIGQQPIMLLFNVIYKLVGVTFDAHNFYLLDTLEPNLKNFVEIVKQDAYANLENLNPIDEALLNSISLEACLKSATQNCEIYIDTMANIREIPQNSYESNLQGGCYSTENIINGSPSYTSWEIDNNFSFDFSDEAECSTHVNFFNSDMEMLISEKSKAVWRKIRAVVKWGILVRKVAAAKRNANLMLVQCA